MSILIIILLLVYIIYLIIFKVILPNDEFDIDDCGNKYNSYIDSYILRKNYNDIEIEVDNIKKRIKHLEFKSRKKFKAQQRKRKKRRI